jgi:hypothetical protein
VKQNKPTFFEIQEIKKVLSTLKHLNNSVESLRAKLDDSDSDGDFEESKMTISQNEEWKDPDHPNCSAFLKNHFDLKQE